MPPLEEFEMQAMALPENLLRAVVQGQHLPNQIIAFIDASIQAAQGGKRVLLLRDFVDQVPQNTSPGDAEGRLMDLRLQLGAQLMMSGAQPIVETGILSPADLEATSPDHLRSNVRWASLISTNQAAKVNHVIQGCTFEKGPRPTHPFLHPETVYKLQVPDSQLFGRYQKADSSRNFLVSVAENAAGRKTMAEVLNEASGADDIEKVFLDTLNMMDAVKSLHARGKVHRDIKYGNAFDGGTVFDNLSVASAQKVATDNLMFGSAPLIPDMYNLRWNKEVTPYFRDIFAFALSVASAIAVASGLPPNVKKEDVIVEFYKRNKSRLFMFRPDYFLSRVEDYFFRSVQNEKLKKAAEVVKMMILGEGDYDIAAAQRDLGAIFGSRAH